MQFNIKHALYILSIYGLTRYFVNQVNKNQENKIKWTPLESVVVTIFIYFFAQIIGGLLVFGVTKLFGWSDERYVEWVSDNAIGQFTAVLIIEALSIFLLIRFLKKRDSTLASIGLIKSVRLIDGLNALGYYAIYFLTYAVIFSFISNFFPSIDVEQKQQIGFDAVSDWQLPFVFISLVILPPLVEEILMRGFLYTGLKASLPKSWAVIITSVLFAAAHLQAGLGANLLWIASIDTFVLSLFLIKLKEKTGSLWAPIFLHGLKNFVAFMSIFIFKIS